MLGLFWVSPLSDPLLLPLCRLIHPARLLVACWNMPWLVVLPDWTDRERERGSHRRRGKRLVVNSFSRVKWPTHRESPWTDSCWCQHVECTRWRLRWMVDLCCCLANWWVSKLCVNRCLWHTQQCYSWTLLRTCALLLKLSEIFRNTN